MKNALRIIGNFLLAFLAGVFYRMGGSGNYPRFVRELGQQFCVIGSFVLLKLCVWEWHSVLGTILSSGACWAESTYFKKKDTDAKWYNWVLVGLVFGMIPLPYCALTQSHWRGFGIRVPVCIILTVLWQQVLSARVSRLIRIGKDVTDEVGRGFINIATLPLLLI